MECRASQAAQDVIEARQLVVLQSAALMLYLIVARNQEYSPLVPPIGFQNIVKSTYFSAPI